MGTHKWPITQKPSSVLGKSIWHTEFVGLIVNSIYKFVENQGPLFAAAMAYYTAFALPSILILSITLVGFFVDPQDIQGEIGRQVENVAGQQAAEQVREIVIAANQSKGTVVASTIGVCMLMIGATGVLVQLQAALNLFWGVEAQPNQNTWLAMVVKRFLSLGMLLVIAFLLLVTITIRAAIDEFGHQIDGLLPKQFSTGMLSLVDSGVSFALLLLLLAAMFRFMPDAKVAWKSVWFGAFVTSVLFSVGKQLMGIYLTVGRPGAVYGAAGSLAVILVWVYYSSIILLFGAQLTSMWAKSHLVPAPPEEHAVKTKNGLTNKT